MQCSSHSKQALIGALAVAIMVTGVASTATAGEVIYWSNRDQDKIERTDITTGVTTDIGPTPFRRGDPDSLIFDNNGAIIFGTINRDNYPYAQTYRMDPTSGATTQITSGSFSTDLRDLALDPTGATMLVSDVADRRLVRIDLTTGARTNLATYASFPGGLAYDGSGDLFLAMGNQIDQINPLTGAILHASGVGQFVDGLTYDPVTHLLYGAQAGCVAAIDPTSLATLGCYGSGRFDNLDGIEADGHGNVVIADIGHYASYAGQYVNGHIFQMDVTSGGYAVTDLADANGIDDIAPIIGPGSPPGGGVPEPSAWALMLAGFGGLGAVMRSRRRMAAASA